MLLSKIDPKNFPPDFKCEVGCPKELINQKIRLERAVTDRYWPRHPRLLVALWIIGVALALLLAFPVAVARVGWLGGMLSMIPIAAAFILAAVHFEHQVLFTGIHWIAIPFCLYEHRDLPAAAINAYTMILGGNYYRPSNVYVQIPSDKRINTAFLTYVVGDRSYPMCSWQGWTATLNDFGVEEVYKDRQEFLKNFEKEYLPR